MAVRWPVTEWPGICLLAMPFEVVEFWCICQWDVDRDVQLV